MLNVLPRCLDYASLSQEQPSKPVPSRASAQAIDEQHKVLPVNQVIKHIFYDSSCTSQQLVSRQALLGHLINPLSKQ